MMTAAQAKATDLRQEKLQVNLPPRQKLYTEFVSDIWPRKGSIKSSYERQYKRGWQPWRALADGLSMR